jgi:hypothetical protein
MNVWVTWNGASRSHAARRGVTPADVRNGDFPLVCGRWAPSGFDAELTVSDARPCRRCVTLVTARERKEEV